jgi:hypothetical protein
MLLRTSQGMAIGSRGGAQSYVRQLRQIFGSGLIALWPMDERSGSVAYDRSGNGRNGAHTGVTLDYAAGIRGSRAIYYDGANDYTNVYSASLAAAFNGNEGTLMTWARVANAAVWTDGTVRVIARCCATVANNDYWIGRSTVNNELTCNAFIGGASKERRISSLESTGWMNIALTWSKTDDAVTAYLDGVARSSIGELGTFVGGLDSTRTIIGAGATTPNNQWPGLIGPTLLCNYAATPAQIAAAYKAALPLPA